MVRWIRLLLVREFSFEEAFYLWDRLFIRMENEMPVLDYACAALLLLKKSEIVKCESTVDVLSVLQQQSAVNVQYLWDLCYLLWEVGSLCQCSSHG